MSRIAYVNGSYVSLARASVHIEDRGYQLGDSVYEVIGVRGGRFFDEDAHLDRLERSLAALEMAWPMSRRALQFVMREVRRRNGVTDGMLYLQVTRGVAPRNQAFPEDTPPCLVMTARRAPRATAESLERGVSVITIPDIRWKRCDIKTTQLLPAVLGKQKALGGGAFEAWQVDESGFVTEGTATNAWIVTRDGRLVTRQADHGILGGIARASLLALAREDGLAPEERPFTVDEAKAAREAFVTGTTTYILPVVRIDGTVIGNGAAGTITRRLQDSYLAHVGGAGASA